MVNGKICQSLGVRVELIIDRHVKIEDFSAGLANKMIMWVYVCFEAVESTAKLVDTL